MLTKGEEISHDIPIQVSPIKVLMLPDGRDANPYQALLAESLEEQGVRVDFGQGYRRVLPFSRLIWQSKQRFQVLHLHWLLPFLKGNNGFVKAFYAVKFLLDVILVKLSGVRIVWTVHNRVTHDTTSPKLEQWVRRKLAKLADEIILHNRATLEELAQEYQFSPQKATVIPHGHYREAYHAQVPVIEARQALGLPTTGTIFLSLGLLRPYKGIDVLLETWCNNQQTFSNCTLVVAGSAQPAYAEKLKAMIADVQNVVLIPEFIADDRIHLFFSAATAVVLPYQKVLNSGSLILAMSYSLPVIAPKLGGICEYLDTATQLLFEPEDEQGLLKSMSLVTQINIEDLRQKTTQACDRLNWTDISRSTYRTYLADA